MTLNCVVCGNNILNIIKKQYDFKIEDIPFRTKRKIERSKCSKCGEEYLDPPALKIIDEEVKIARNFLAEQDAQYRINNNSPVIPLHPPEYYTEESLPQTSKQWFDGFITYLRYATTTDTMKIVPASTPYKIYCNEAERIAVAIKQFVKPDDFFKLVSIS